MQYQRLQFHSYVQQGEKIRILVDEIHGHHPAHAHDDFIEIAYIDGGRGVHILNGREERISEGNLFLFNPHIVHAFTADEDAPLRVYNCLFQPPTLDYSFKNCKDFVDVAYHYLFYSLYSEDDPKDYIKLTGVSGEDIRLLFYEMQREYDSMENGYEQVLKADLMKLLIFIFRLYKKDNRQRQNAAVYKRLVVQEAAAYIKDHFAEKFLLRTAGRAGLFKRQLLPQDFQGDHRHDHDPHAAEYPHACGLRPAGQHLYAGGAGSRPGRV